MYLVPFKVFLWSEKADKTDVVHMLPLKTRIEASAKTKGIKQELPKQRL